MKATLEFDIADPYEAREHLMSTKGPSAFLVLHNFMEELCKMLNDEDCKKEEAEFLKQVRANLIEELDYHGVNLDLVT